MRRKEIAYGLLILGLLPLISGCVCKPPLISSVNVNLIPQQRDWWCWAASAEMISEYYGHKINQCEAANYVHGTPPDCCTGCSGDCPGWGSAWGASITDVKNTWANWNFDYTYRASSLTWDTLKQTISTSKHCCQSPVEVVWWWTGGGGHVVVAYGYAEVGGEKYVSYRNPWPPNCAKSDDLCSPVSGGEDAVMTYDAFVSSGSHNWGNSFYKFKYTGP